MCLCRTYCEKISRHAGSPVSYTHLAVLQVPMEEASRFGIMHADANGIIDDFEEKPKHPKSNQASMGIYVFSKEALERYLRLDAADPSSDNDFGKNVIPAMLHASEKLLAYPFEGYWKDVGTLDSLWEANMDLLGAQPVSYTHLDVYKRQWFASRNGGCIRSVSI